jgi:hypothetical protein
VPCVAPVPSEKGGGSNKGALLDRGIRVIFIPPADQVVRCGSDIVLVDDLSQRIWIRAYSFL